MKVVYELYSKLFSVTIQTIPVSFSSFFFHLVLAGIILGKMKIFGIRLGCLDVVKILLEYDLSDAVIPTEQMIHAELFKEHEEDQKALKKILKGNIDSNNTKEQPFYQRVLQFVQNLRHIEIDDLSYVVRCVDNDEFLLGFTDEHDFDDCTDERRHDMFWLLDALSCYTNAKFKREDFRFHSVE